MFWVGRCLVNLDTTTRINTILVPTWILYVGIIFAKNMYMILKYLFRMVALVDMLVSYSLGTATIYNDNNYQ